MYKSSHRIRAVLRVGTLGLVCATVFIQGCVSPLTRKSDLDTLTQRHGLGHVYYIGTNAGFHYFASNYLYERTKYYRLPEAEYSFQNPFPKTSDKSQWIPFLYNLNDNTQGFRGEPKESLQATNSARIPQK
jgi:hypothetical protein